MRSMRSATSSVTSEVSRMNSQWHLNSLSARMALFTSLTACGIGNVSTVDQDAAVAPAGDEAALAAQFYAPELGKGVDAAETRTYIKCVNFTAPKSERLPFSKRLYQDYSVNNRQDLDKKLNLSASASAKGLWGEAGGSGSYFRDKEFDSDAFYWVVDANYELLHESIPTNDEGFGLTERAKNLLRTQGVKGFIRSCGTHFYVGRTLGGRYVMLYEFRSNQDKFVDNIKATARARANFGLEGETELARAIQSANRSALMKVSTEVTGGDAQLDSYASDPNLLKAELLKLRTALEKGSGQVLEWEMVSYDVFEEFQQAEHDSGYRPAFDTKRRDALEMYYTTYTQNQQRLSDLRTSLKRAEGAAPQVYFTPATERKVRGLMDSLQAQNKVIGKRARMCLGGADRCDVAALPALREVPAEELLPDRDYTQLAGWSLTPYERPHGRANIDFFATPPDAKCHLRFFSTGNTVTSQASGLFANVKQHRQRVDSLRIGTPELLRQGSSRFTPNICVNEFASVCSLRLIEDFSHSLDDGCPQPRLELSVYDESGFCTDRLVFGMFQ